MRFHLTALAFLWLSLTPASSFPIAPKCTTSRPSSSATSSRTVLFSAASYDETNYNHNYNPFEVVEGDQLQRPGEMSYDNYPNAPPPPPRRNQPFLPNTNTNNDNNYIPPRPPAMNWQRASQERQQMRQTPQLSQRQPRDDFYSNSPPTSNDNYQAYQQNEQYFENNSPPQPPQYNNVWQTEPPRGYAPPESVPPRDQWDNPTPPTNNNRQGFLQGIQQLEERAMAAAAAQNEPRDPSSTPESDAATRKLLEESFGKLEQSFNLRLDRNRDIYDDLWDEANRIYQNLQRMDTNQKLDYLLNPFRNFMNKIHDQRMLPSANQNNKYNFNNNNNRDMPNQGFNNNNNNLNMPNQGFQNNMQQYSPNNSLNNLPSPRMNGMPNQQMNTRNTFQNNNNNFGTMTNKNAGFNAPMSSNQGPPNAMQQPNNMMPNRPATNNFSQNNNNSNQLNNFSQPNSNGFGGNGGFGNGNGIGNGNNMPNSFAPTPNAFPKTNMANNNRNTNTNTNTFTPLETEGLKNDGAWQ